MKQFFIINMFLLTTTLFSCSGNSQENDSSTPGQETSWQEVIEYAQEHLPQHGYLAVKSDGFGYLKVDDEYIHTLFPMLGLADEGFKEPPYFRSPEAPGAHISIFYADEEVMPEEIGQQFGFTLTEIKIVKPQKNVSYVVLQVEAPELENLRKKYGLSPKLHGHEYHISLGKKITRVPKSK